jgi:chromosomal replication initiation ATPase DnaA
MFVENEIMNHRYRGHNPAFVRAVMLKRKKAVALQDAEERAVERKRAKTLQAEAAARIEAARAELSNQKIVVYRLDGDQFQHTYSMIEARALRLFRMTRAELRSNRRDKEIVFARQFIMYWTARLTQHSLPLIGRLMGGRDHTTCLHGRKAYIEKRARMGRTLRNKRGK